MCHVYIFQILWLNDPHSGLTVSLSLSRYLSPFPTYRYLPSLLWELVSKSWAKMQRDESWKSVEFFCLNIRVSKALSCSPLSWRLRKEEAWLGRVGSSWRDTLGSPARRVCWGPQKMLCPPPLIFYLFAHCLPSPESLCLVSFLTGKLDLCPYGISEMLRSPTSFSQCLSCYHYWYLVFPIPWLRRNGGYKGVWWIPSNGLWW